MIQHSTHYHLAKVEEAHRLAKLEQRWRTERPEPAMAEQHAAPVRVRARTRLALVASTVAMLVALVAGASVAAGPQAAAGGGGGGCGGQAVKLVC